MPFLVETAKAANANSYCTVDRADEIISTRLYSSNWDSADSVPSADGYLVNEASPSIGDAEITIDTGSGRWTAGTKFKFAGHAQIYVVIEDLPAAGDLKFTPELVAAPADNEALNRVTANDKERSLIWATRLLDNLFVWKGTKRTEEQSLRWPRSGVLDPDGYEYDYDTVPTILEESTAEYALELLASDRFKTPDLLGKGIERAKVGSVEITVDSSTGQEPAVPDGILALLSPLGHLEAEAQGSTTVVPLRRV